MRNVPNQETEIVAAGSVINGYEVIEPFVITYTQTFRGVIAETLGFCKTEPRKTKDEARRTLIELIGFELDQIARVIAQNVLRLREQYADVIATYVKHFKLE